MKKDTASTSLRISGENQTPARRDAVLNAAEALFSQHGFDGVTVRQVAKLAGVDVALPNYYFVSKRGLFDAVFARRAEALNHLRSIRLEEILVRASEAEPLKVRDILWAFISPVAEAQASHDPGWGHYCRLVAQVNSSSVWSKMMTQSFDAIILRFIEALRLALPALSEKDIFWAYHFLSGSLTLSMAATGRIDSLSHNLCRSDDAEAVYDKLISFFAGAYEAMAKDSGKDSGAAGAKA
jgi:AcrR family transcriptional regulator